MLLGDNLPVTPLPVFSLMVLLCPGSPLPLDPSTTIPQSFSCKYDYGDLSKLSSSMVALNTGIGISYIHLGLAYVG